MGSNRPHLHRQGRGPPLLAMNRSFDGCRSRRSVGRIKARNYFRGSLGHHDCTRKPCTSWSHLPFRPSIPHPALLCLSTSNETCSSGIRVGSTSRTPVFVRSGGVRGASSSSWTGFHGLGRFFRLSILPESLPSTGSGSALFLLSLLLQACDT